MASFENNMIYRLKAADARLFCDYINPRLAEGEQILSSYQTVRDGVVFTTARVFGVDIQGMLGTDAQVFSLPYKSVQAFAVENPDAAGAEGELVLFLAGKKQVRFVFASKADLTEIGKNIAKYTL